MPNLDEKLAKLEAQMAEAQERMDAIKSRKAVVLSQQRQERKREHDRTMLLLGRAVEHGLKSESDANMRDTQLATLRELANTAFAKTNIRDRSKLLAYLDHLTETLEPLSHPNKNEMVRS